MPQISERQVLLILCGRSWQVICWLLSPVFKHNSKAMNCHGNSQSYIMMERITQTPFHNYYPILFLQQVGCPVSWGCRIHWRHHCWGQDPPPKCVLDMTLNKNDGEVPIMQEVWGMQSTSSLPLLPDPLWAGVVAPDRVLSMGQIELNCVLMLNWIDWNRSVLKFMLNWIVWKRTVLCIIVDTALITYNGWFAKKPNQINRSALKFISTWVSEKYSNILVCASLWCVYYMTKAVQAMEDIHRGR